jgi:NAD(P)-dependent dehydrogenase (short-subunit alcohol dehydrogenase family)
MKLAEKNIVITGAGSGIGHGMALRFAQEKPAGIVVSDLPGKQAELDALVEQLSATGVKAASVTADVGMESDVFSLVSSAREHMGQIDVFASNAGLIRDGDENAPDSDWQLNWQVHLMAHVYAARAVVPEMMQRGEGYLLNTASAAGLLTSLPSATYAVTKHSAIALAEYLSIRYGNDGIRVSVLCPQAVATPMIQGRDGASSAAQADGVMTVEQLAEVVVNGMDKESFLILPHPEVYEYFGRKGKDYDRWLGGMRRFAQKLGLSRQ